MEAGDHPRAPSLYQRVERILDPSSDTDKVLLRLMQWNILADCLAYSFPKTPQEYLQKDFRLPLIIEEMQQAGLPLKNADSESVGTPQLPDIILCQEMDMADEVLSRLNALDVDTYGTLNYKHEMIAKTGDHNDALCVFYNANIYTPLHVKKDYYKGPNGDLKSRRCYLMILFEHIPTGKKIVTCTLHLKAKKPNRKIRVMEITEYLLKFQDFLQELSQENHVKEEDAKHLPIIIAGDFNDDPDSEVIEPMFDTDMTGGIKLKCAYQIDGQFPEFTTHKYRSDEVTKHVIDYIFYNQNL